MSKIKCRDCEKIINKDELENAYEIDGEYVCQDCFNENYFYCDRCGSIELQENGTHIQDTDLWVCENCRDYYTYCEDCGEYFEYTTYIEGHGSVCEHCYDYGDYGYCEGCGNYYHRDYLNYSEYHDCDYCDDCYSEYNNDRIYGYHEFNDWRLFKGATEETPTYYIGKEIEIEPKNCYGGNVDNILDIMNNHINAVGMHDGSLSCDGVEVVTHPESWQYLQEHKQNYIDFFKEIEEENYGNGGHCGLHFHVTRPSEDVVSRVIVILESFKDEIKKLSRRNGNSQWSRFITDNGGSELDNIKYKSTKYIKENYVNGYHDRYVALNLNNSKTIEFRFFSGANNFEEFWGALQFIHNIMEVALDETRDINTITWNELINGEELQEQARKQEVLNIDKVVKDTTEILEKIEKAKEETKEDIKRTLRNFIKYLTREMQSKKLDTIDINNILDIETKGRDYINTLSNNLRYIENINSFYRSINDYSINRIKDTVKYYKENNNNAKDYSRYFKQIEKSIDKFESEVNA